MPKQLLLIIGAMLLLTQISLNVNGSILQMYDTSYENEALLTATALNQSVIREVTSKSFDEVTITKSVGTPDSLTLPVNLGPEPGEVYPGFDDVDDFNGHVRTMTQPRLGTFTISVNVWYTNRTLLGGNSTSRTFLKTVVVTVSGNQALKNPVNIQSIIAY